MSNIMKKKGEKHGKVTTKIPGSLIVIKETGFANSSAKLSNEGMVFWLVTLGNS